MSSRLELAIGLAGLAGAFALLGLGGAWVRVWFYDLAWYPWLLALDGLARLRTGRSLVFDRGREFLLLLPWSVFIWLVFEHFNLVLNNWHYLNLPPEKWLRWPGYFIAFATVLPAVLLTAEALAAWGVLKRVRVRPRLAGRGWYTPFYLIGLAMFLLPLIWPRYFFPLVWGSFIFLLEPMVHRLGGRSLAAEWQRGELTTFCRLLLAGLICGGVWEGFNFFAGARWIYTVPFVGCLKVFEMPLLGFLGFPPFAVECFVIYALIDVFRGQRFFRPEAAPAGGLARPWKIGTVALWLAYYWLVFRAIDRYTVISFSG